MNMVPRVAIGKNGAAGAAGPRIADETAQLSALRTIVDDLDYGIVVLDRDRRVQYVNRAFRRFWCIPDAAAAGAPSFIKLMYHGRGATAYAVSDDRLGDYVAKQLDLIGSGEERPLSIRLANGDVLRFRCKALPDGGRLLTYGNVSDLAREADALERLASFDAMTGLYNRRQFLLLADGEWARYQRYGRSLALIVMDIDQFKSVNDTYGQDAGDKVIKAVAEILQRHKRATDIVGRLGGEEFGLMLPEATLDSAVGAGERFRKLAAGCAIDVGGRALSITVSVGASVCNPDTGGVDELVKEADAALCDAKRAGRNRVCRFEPRRGPEIKRRTKRQVRRPGIAASPAGRRDRRRRSGSDGCPPR